MALDVSQLILELSLELDSETTVLSGSCILDKLPAPVARILFLEKKGKCTKLYFGTVRNDDHTFIFLHTSVHTFEPFSAKAHLHKTDLLLHVQEWNRPGHKWTP